MRRKGNRTWSFVCAFPPFLGGDVNLAMLELPSSQSYQRKRGKRSKAMPLELILLYKGKEHRGGGGRGREVPESVVGPPLPRPLLHHHGHPTLLPGLVGEAGEGMRQ